MYEILSYKSNGRFLPFKTKILAKDAEVLSELRLLLLQVTGEDAELTYKEYDMNIYSELKKQLFELVSKTTKPENIEGREVIFLKHGIMLSKNSSGHVKVFDTKPKDYIEISNLYLIKLIMRDYEVRQN